MSDNIRAVEKFLKQKAVYWPKTGVDDSGNPVHGEAEEIKCRWEDVAEIFMSVNATEEVSNARVLVDRDLTLDGVLWLGELEDLESQTEPFENEGAKLIRKFDKMPDRKGTKFCREATL